MFSKSGQRLAFTALLLCVLTEYSTSFISHPMAQRRTRVIRPLRGQSDANVNNYSELSVTASPLNYSDFPPVFRVFADKLSRVAGNWALTYADLSPETPTSIWGILFLTTNVGYSIGGLTLAMHGDYFFGTMLEIAGLVSIWYHHQHLSFPQPAKEVQLALLTDYIVATAAISTGAAYALDTGLQNLPGEAVLCGVIAVAFLFLGWAWEYGIRYIINHSMWHIFGALAAYSVGSAHLGLPSVADQLVAVFFPTHP